jgi:hypothetical protein
MRKPIALTTIAAAICLSCVALSPGQENLKEKGNPAKLPAPSPLPSASPAVSQNPLTAEHLEQVVSKAITGTLVKARWEYKVTQDPSEIDMNRMGNSGWEFPTIRGVLRLQ